MDQSYSLSDTGSLILGSALLISDQSNETGYVCLDPDLRYFENDENWFQPEMDLDEKENFSLKIKDTSQANVTGYIKQGKKHNLRIGYSVGTLLSWGSFHKS